MNRRREPQEYADQKTGDKTAKVGLPGDARVDEPGSEVHDRDDNQPGDVEAESIPEQEEKADEREDRARRTDPTVLAQEVDRDIRSECADQVERNESARPM